ncbi:DNA mismatch repair endonuclease MutL [Anaerobacillus isosaccharinicus]|uniref:DNA mismatch repair protein MutL n=1 Tax=Anaerobacillus isosaccharinicus TaxID=1532552 RepID=A0A1S2M932_9BACI|nr:DNA mismatch repair endonuclease MutL [Anaerobacillus isosaccharinicus]MBA5587251.1 DNA mismatch repair endonuclease MutL [Anaerobacillus isosaccharinicus]QOY34555.1 DNA mismatch repair endonuclease MutL [Anaerobacillus isosaccharinicus]
MGKIIKLDEYLSNKIAAGEVVERPASIVKELAENSIDANSTTIHIEVEEGGLQKIRIVDNGDGIDEEDCLVAFHRHATSKISTDKDLFRIRTLGFRGEALPSIASVSYLTLKTCTGNQVGTAVVIEGGKIVEHGPSPSRKGTDITVTNLFYNTPARLKYLKTIHTELGNITDYVYRLALAYPSISFRLDHNGKKVFSSNGNGDLRQVIASIYGMNIAKQMLYFENSSLDFKISGYVCKPEVTRASRQYMSTFINYRYIKNFPLSKAIQDGYHTLLPIGRYPVVVLQVEMDPTLIDVNVHPSKLEVRLSKEDELNKLVTETIKLTFKQVQLIPEVKRPPIEKEKSEQIAFSLEHQIKKINVDEDQNSVSFRKDDELILRETAKVQEFEELAPRSKIVNPVKEVERYTSIENKVPLEERVPVLYPIGQMHGTYILAQNEKGLYILDQHAAQERIKYEYYRQKVGEDDKQLQDLLVPISFEFTGSEIDRIKANEGSLQDLGIFMEPFGQHSFIVRSHPTWFPTGLEEEVIKDIVEEVLNGKKVTVGKLREEAAILMSCKASIKANRHLRNDEMFSLLETLRKCEDPFTCPHGRPIFVHFTTYEMEKMFKRIM